MDYDAFCRLVDTHGTALYRFCRKLSPGEADDLYQETFLRALEHCSRIDDTRNVKSYLFTVCINLWRNALRKTPQHTDIEYAFDLSSPDDTPEEAAVRNETARNIAALIRTLDEKHRLPLYLFYTAEMPLNEIARALKIPAGTVKSRLFRARTLLKERLEVSDYE